jgi:HK97 family phage prohead protease
MQALRFRVSVDKVGKAMSSGILYRTAGLIRADDNGEGRTLYGTAVPYDQVTVINELGRTYRESFAYGAFERSIAERGHKVKLFIGHDRRKLPIGRAVELTETVDGLSVAFEVADTTAGRDALEAVRSGLADQFSVGFTPIRHRNDDGVIVRTEAGIREVSLVSEGAYSGALVGGVRSESQPVTVDLARKRFEMLLESF